MVLVPLSFSRRLPGKLSLRVPQSFRQHANHAAGAA